MSSALGEALVLSLRNHLRELHAGPQSWLFKALYADFQVLKMKDKVPLKMPST